jgi:hypothetical protein
MKARTAKLFVVLAALAAAACGNANPEDLPPVDGEPDAGQVDPGPVALTITPSSVITPWDSVPITGAGPANGTLVYESAAGGQDTIRLGSTGEFCLDISLVDGDNTIKFEAISEAGEYSDAEFLTIRKEGEPPEIEPVDPGNIILADRTPGTVYYMQDVPYNSETEIELDSGTFSGLVDGNTNEIVQFHADGILTGETLAFTLDEQMSVHRFEVTVPDRDDPTCGPDGYELWVSNEEMPELILDGLTWLKVAERPYDDISQTATTYEDEVSVPGIRAKHFAIKFTDTSCAFWFTLDPRSAYGVAEIRVIAEDGDSVPVITDGAPSCARGGF